MRDASGVECRVHTVARKTPVAPTFTQSRPVMKEVAVQWPGYRARPLYESLFLRKYLAPLPTYVPAWDAAKAMYRRQQEPVHGCNLSSLMRVKKSYVAFGRSDKISRQNPPGRFPAFSMPDGRSHPSQWEGPS